MTITGTINNQNLLIAHFETIADAPNGVARLRELILQLALQGRLVEQDPTDEPASLLLQRITGLSKTGEWHGQEDTVPPYGIPSKWIWTSFDDIVDFKVGKTPPTKEAKYWSKEGTPWVSISDMKHYEIVTHTDRKISAVAEEEIFKGNISPAGTLLMSFKLTIGKVSILGIDAYHNEAIISIYPKSAILREYLFRFLPILALQGNTKNAIKGSTLNKESLSKMPIPLPPTSEQYRIVERVDQLMALCDALEERQARQGKDRKRLLASLIDALLHAAGSDEVATAWARLRDNFDLVFDVPESVAPLRQSVLQLAVQGQLVEQDPADEPASVLLERIEAEKTRLVKTGKLKKIEPTRPISHDEQPFDTPRGWDWATIGELYEVVGGIQKTPKRQPQKNIYPYLRVANVYRGYLDLNEIAHFELFDGELERWRLLPGDLLVVEGNGSENEIGRCAQWNGEIENCVHQNHLIRCRSFVDGYQPFVLTFLNSPSGISEMKRLAITTTGLHSLSVGKIRDIVVPVPCLAEQHRIVERVDQLMSLCDQLEAKLREERAAAQQVAEALCKTIAAARPAIAQRPEERANRAVVLELPARRQPVAVIQPVEAEAILLAYALQRHLGTPGESSLGHVKAEKIVHLVEAATQRDLGRQPSRMARGPADPRQLEQAIAVGRNWDAFEVTAREHAAWGYQFKPRANLAQVAARFTEAFDEQAGVAARIVDLLVPLTSRQSEAVATLYAVWNDLRRTGDEPDDDQIYAAFRAFHPKKERFRPEVLVRWLAWMRQHNLLPTGAAKPTMPARELASSRHQEMLNGHTTTSDIGSRQNGIPVQAQFDLGNVAQNSDTTYSAVKTLLAERGALTNADLQAVLGLDAATAREVLHRLVTEGLAYQEGQRRGMRYILSV